MKRIINPFKSEFWRRPNPIGEHSDLKIALIADELTRSCISQNALVKNLTPTNYPRVFNAWEPDFIFVESAWNGINSSWKYQIASYPDYPERNNRALRKMLRYARRLGIPAVFWNKEDGVHFERFINSAKLFNYIFTVDELCIPRYREHVASTVYVDTMMFPVQPLFHNFSGFNFQYFTANFVGSYSRHMHDARRYWQDHAFKACSDSGLGLIVYDRNSNRKAQHYRYPSLPLIRVKHAIQHSKTGLVYKDNLVTLNVNTIVDSPTMYSRRLVEALACGAIVVSNPSVAMETHFKDYCYIVDNQAEMLDLFSRLKYGPSDDDLERAKAGSEFVLSQHTWHARLRQIIQILDLRH